ncbi:DNA-binding protein [Amycolatopsis balhimycina DSM 5908]|uniref:DNA-binding protein n=1 Tax=Amycolatopsis balhimycina DSM 5908 TaxID=1081091 RepID=A0A428VYV3_AMYBA|nr:helix-turn-helix domain-containing protein [Amycolatopsis balhimycina]RSM35986.1 DNA-binding protein [Amycolatopsis balhimycina DSM 5908]
MDTNQNVGPTFYTVRKVARILRVNPVTLYRAIRDDAFPAVRIRTRYVIPAAALNELIAEVTASGGCIDLAEVIAKRRMEREANRAGGASW